MNGQCPPKDSATPLPRIGWYEWIRLPDIDVEVKAKVDTGARTSAIHAENVCVVGDYVRFLVHPNQNDDANPVDVTLPIVDQILVRPSSGVQEERFVVVTTVELNGERWPVEVTLASRTQMGFRMLLGRSAVAGRFVVDPGASYVQSDRRTKLRAKKQRDDRDYTDDRSPEPLHVSSVFPITEDGKL